MTPTTAPSSLKERELATTLEEIETPLACSRFWNVLSEKDETNSCLFQVLGGALCERKDQL